MISNGSDPFVSPPPKNKCQCDLSPPQPYILLLKKALVVSNFSDFFQLFKIYFPIFQVSQCDFAPGSCYRTPLQYTCQLEPWSLDHVLLFTGSGLPRKQICQNIEEEKKYFVVVFRPRTAFGHDCIVQPCYWNWFQISCKGLSGQHLELFRIQLFLVLCHLRKFPRPFFVKAICTQSCGPCNNFPPASQKARGKANFCARLDPTVLGSQPKPTNSRIHTSRSNTFWPRRLCVLHPRWRLQCVAGHCYYQLSVSSFFNNFCF